MALAWKLPYHREDFSHRRWRDIGGITLATCTVADEKRLMQLASQADCIIHREAPGKQSDPRTAAQILDRLHAAKLLLSGTVQNPHLVLKRLKIVLGDRLARTRIVDGRHALAGLVQMDKEGDSEKVLVVVLASRQVTSCDWLLAPGA